jgi:hypothetical protein
MWPGAGIVKKSLGARHRVGIGLSYTDKQENQIFLIYREIQSGAVAKSYMTNGLLIYREIFAHFLIYQEALPHI